MEEIYVNVSHLDSDDKITSRKQTGPRSSESRFHGAVVLCLGLLSVFLLAGLIGLAVHHGVSVRRSAAELSTIKANLTERLQDSINHISSMTKERDLLNTSLIQLTEETNRLKSLSKQKKSCPAGWTMFRCSCYLLSTQAGSWDKGRQDCRDREAELVTIDSYEEQVFVSALNKKDTWLGLNDIETEGTWKWADGTALTVKYWTMNQPDNGNGDPQYGEEDCGHFYHATKADGNWNDLRCNSILQWICEKMA
ncbi:CD209 antigen-like protein E [Mastacembelus armatus]|uniref:CD209 antigen-like protein E n=1 Tax=Mastacembelus armatus TaxID=205130 RepID=UPI000E45CB27|nr:CD209 antigen-like protein E [Mastacembelus armatus]XP_026152066.1 CD209 antigen-like protein E [Mastacembelus armatus]